MKLVRFKYTIVLFMMGIFVAQGLVFFAPLLSLNQRANTQEELLMNTAEERSEEKETEKPFSVKEFIHDHDVIPDITFSHPISANSTLFKQYHYTIDVFLPVHTPPPRFID